MPFRLAIEDGRFATTLEVHGGDVTAGSAPRCGLRLAAGGVGKRHATFRQCGRHVVVEDLGAKDGVHVDGKRVHRASLRVGQWVRLGEARIRVTQITPREAGAIVVPRSRRNRGRRAAPFVVSAVLHGVLFAAAWTWALFHVAPLVADTRLEIGSLEAPAELVAADEKAPVVEPMDLVQRDTSDVDLLPVEPDEPPKPLADDDPRMQKPEPVTPPPADVLPAATKPVIGVGGGIPAEMASRGFGKGDAGTANRTAAGLIETTGDGTTLRAARSGSSKARVWVIRGDYDQAEKVLDELTIEHALLGKEDLETREIPAEVRVVFYNCTGRALSPEAQQRIAAWVSAGGWLVSTDWGVERLLEKGLPGTLTPLRVGDRPVLTKDETVGVHPTTDRGLAAGTGGVDVPARWWLEDSSVPFTITAGIGAEVLVRSDELERRNGKDASAVAVTFPYGRGRVLHMLGHVFQQEGNLRGAVIVQRLVVNYVAAALAVR